MCQLLESIKCQDGVLYNLAAHQNRMRTSMHKLLGVEAKLDLKRAIKKVAIPRKGLYKCRIIYGRDINRIEFVAYERNAVIDVAFIEDNTMSYSHKLLDRSCIEKHTKTLSYDTEVVFIKKDRITDASYSNIALYNGTEWHTPTYPLLKGTMRNRLLEEGKIKRQDIMYNDIKAYSHISFINALNDLEERVFKL